MRIEPDALVGNGGRHFTAGEDERQAVRRGNRRRLRVFGLTLVAVLVLGQAWNLARPAEYQASTRLQIDLPDAGLPGPATTQAFASRVQLLNSRPLLARLASALAEAHGESGEIGPAAVAELQAMLEVRPVPDSEVVQVLAVGAEPAALAETLNALPALVRAELATRQQGDADRQLADAREELARLERAAQTRREQLDAFRRQAGVSSEREENEAVARSKGLSQSLSVAIEKEAAAAARREAVAAAVAAGRSSTLARADPTLSGLEARAHQAREELREMERGYTPDFIAMDPRARAVQARLAELERQLAEQRLVSQEAALQSAEEDHASARAQVDRLRAQLAAARPALATVSAQLNASRTLAEDLEQLERTRRTVLERVARLEANERRRQATVTVIEPATLPTAPFRPDRARDALYVGAGAFLLALLATGTVELFNRRPILPALPGSTTLVLPPGWPGASDRVPRLDETGAPHARIDAGPRGPQALPAPDPLLTSDEAAALLEAADGPARLACAAGLMGLSLGELLALRAGDIDLASAELRVGGAWARQLPMPPGLRPLASAAAVRDPQAALLGDAAGQPLTEDDVQSMVASAALDAGLPQAAALRYEALRHTGIDWLIGQGLRFSDLPQRVGRVDPALLAGLARRHADVPRRAADSVAWLMPALRASTGG